MAMDPMLERNSYGVLVSNQWPAEYMQEFLDQIDGEVMLEDPRLARIVRLRLLSDPGFPMWDVSYCYGELHDGTKVRVGLPRHQFSKRHLKSELVAMCRESRVYGKGLGLFDPETISKLM